MSVTLLAEYRGRRAAHGRHVCQLCFRKIANRERYLDQRCAGDGHVWTFRAHLDCDSAYWSWRPDEDEFHRLTDLSDGHLPPCLLAWDNHEHEPCTCEGKS